MRGWISFQIILVGLSTGATPAPASADCPRLYELWATDQTSHCTGLQFFSVLDFIQRMEDHCGCPSAHLEQLTAVYGGTGLDDPYEIVFSPDERHFYVVGARGIGVFERDSKTGTLANIEVKRNGVDGVEGISRSNSLAISPDGNHLYCPSFSYDERSLAVFQRDPETGILDLIEVYWQGIDGIDGLWGVDSIAVSPDGKNVYAAAYFGQTLAVFRRDPLTGLLVFHEILMDGIDGVQGLGQPNSLTLSPCGGFVYVTSMEADSLVVFKRSTTMGDLTFLEVHRDGRKGIDGLDGPNSVALSEDGNNLYVPSAREDAVVVFQRDPDLGKLTYLETHRNDIQGVEGLAAPHSIRLGPGGHHLYAMASGEPTVAFFQREPSTGSLTFLESIPYADDGFGSRGLPGLSADGNYLYLSWRISVMIFQRNQTTGRLTPVDEERNGEDRIESILWVDRLIQSPDGTHLYTFSSERDRLTVFQRDPVTGELTFLEAYDESDIGIENFWSVDRMGFSPDGNHLYLTAPFEDALVVFARDATTGALVLVQEQRNGVDGVEGMDHPSSITISPDGNYLYTTGPLEHALLIFQRDQVTGALAFMAVIRGGDEGVDGLELAHDTSLSPDGAHLYVASAGEHAVAVFQRDQVTGSLSFMEVHRDGENGVTGLEEVFLVKLSPDGNNLYTATYAGSVAVFQRDQATGSLTFLKAYFNGVDGVSGLDGVLDLVIDPGGDYLLLPSYIDKAVVVFQRNRASGSLTFLKEIRDGVDGIHGILAPMSASISPDSKFTYICGNYDGSIGIFSYRPE